MGESAVEGTRGSLRSRRQGGGGRTAEREERTAQPGPRAPTEGRARVREAELEERSRNLIEADSGLAILTTCAYYVINDLRKKKRQFAIGISTIFLTVCVVTYLDSLMGLAPAVTFIASQSAVGDFDILIQKRSEKDILIPGNQNYFSHQSKSFTNYLDRSKNFYELLIERLEKHEMLPLVNYTWLNQTLKEQNYGSRLKPGKKERVLGRFSPRWMALSKLVNLNQEENPERTN